MTGRSRQTFPTRTYSYTSSAAFSRPAVTLSSGKIFRFLRGRDVTPVEISPMAGAAQLADPFAQLILFSGNPLPLTTRILLSRLDSFNSDPARGIPDQRSFVVADGGQIPWTPETDELLRSFRISITRTAAGAKNPDILISTAAGFDSETIFLQVIGWDPNRGAFQFYERRNGSWVWAGSSFDSLDVDTRGNGPFDSHVNGALNMKELKVPWVNWHSQSAQILDTTLAPDDPLRAEPLWTSKSAAQVYETEVVRPGIQRWFTSRVEQRTESGRLTRLPEFFRQILGGSTNNLVSSSVSSARLATAQTLNLPLSFFVNRDVLFDVLGLSPNVTVPQVPASVSREILDRHEVALNDGRFKFKGDTHFVFVVPEAAFEDNLVVHELITRSILSRQTAAALLMVDFPNPVFSRRRAALLRYVPESARADDPHDFETVFVTAIRSAGAAAGSPEAEFLDNISLEPEQWQRTFEERIEHFFERLTPQFARTDSFAPIFELAESRRREFRRRPIAEFRLTTPVTNIPETAPLLEFISEAVVQAKN